MATDLHVADAMSSPVVTAAPDATLEDVARLMLEHRVGCVVIAERDRPVGIVTETDFDVEDEPIPFTFFKWPRLFGRHVWSEESLEETYGRARARRARTVMAAPVVTVAPDASLWDAVRTMVAHEVKRLPVVEGDRLVGIVTRSDLLKCLAPPLATT